jgi:hypothetical protein
MFGNHDSSQLQRYYSALPHLLGISSVVLLQQGEFVIEWLFFHIVCHNQHYFAALGAIPPVVLPLGKQAAALRTAADAHVEQMTRSAPLEAIVAHQVAVYMFG